MSHWVRVVPSIGRTGIRKACSRAFPVMAVSVTFSRTCKKHTFVPRRWWKGSRNILDIHRIKRERNQKSTIQRETYNGQWTSKSNIRGTVGNRPDDVRTWQSAISSTNKMVSRTGAKSKSIAFGIETTCPGRRRKNHDWYRWWSSDTTIFFTQPRITTPHSGGAQWRVW